MINDKLRDQIERRLMVLRAYIALLRAEPEHGPQRFVFEEGLEARNTPCRAAILKLAGQCGLPIEMSLDSFVLHPAPKARAVPVAPPLVTIAAKPPQ